MPKKNPVRKPRVTVRSSGAPFAVGDYATCIEVDKSTIRRGITKGKVLRIDEVTDLGDGMYGVRVSGEDVTKYDSGWQWFAHRFKKVGNVGGAGMRGKK